MSNNAGGAIHLCCRQEDYCDGRPVPALSQCSGRHQPAFSRGIAAPTIPGKRQFVALNAWSFIMSSAAFQTRLSDFSVLVPISGKRLTLALNTREGTSVAIPDETATRVAAGDLETLPAYALATLIDHAILTTLTHEEERSAFLRVLDECGKEALTATPRAYLMPSYGCNLKCVYCFQHKIRSTTPSVRMSEQTARAAFEWLDRALKEITPRGLTLYGGEPLTPENRSIVNFICREAKRNNFSVMAATHGWNLDCYEDLLGPGKIATLHVTVDGPASIHDRLRVGPHRAATFDRIMAHIQVALAHDTRVRMRVNVDARVLDLLEEFRGYLSASGILGNPLFRAYVAPMFATKAQVNTQNTTMTATLVDESMIAQACGEPRPGPSVWGVPSHV